MRNSWWRTHRPRHPEGPTARHDLRLFRAAGRDDAADRAAGRGAAGRGSSPPPSPTIMRPSPPRGTATAGCSAATSRCTNISRPSCTPSSRSSTTSSTSARPTSITAASTSTWRSCCGSRTPAFADADARLFRARARRLQVDHARAAQAARKPVAADQVGGVPLPGERHGLHRHAAAELPRRKVRPAGSPL